MKHRGILGFVRTDAIRPGVYLPVTDEREYYMDVLLNTVYRNKSNYINDNIDVRNKFSIISDSYINKHLSSIAYVEWAGSKWKVESVKAIPPRIEIMIGGVWHDEQSN